MKRYFAFPGTSPSDCLVLYPGYSLVLPLCRGPVGVVYNSADWTKEKKKKSSYESVIELHKSSFVFRIKDVSICGKAFGSPIGHIVVSRN